MSSFLETTIKAAKSAGDLLKEHYYKDKEVDSYEQYDIKLELDVMSQNLISEVILNDFPDHSIIGEEGDSLSNQSEYHWVVDPIDGTVNYFYGIPHFCVSIALKKATEDKWLVGVIYDPMMDELWAVEDGQEPTLNGRPISTSQRSKMSDAVVTVGFSKSKEALDAGFERYRNISTSVRKSRMMGSAALALAYIACGRLDAYIEDVISLWDIAAGKLLVEAAGGKVDLIESKITKGKLSICSWNGRLPLDNTI
ncbi:MAG: inositol monophosphatase family protein [Verrucomicrobiota bacterium]|nr:inositol monophosphatase family protein [Verrucomicrobiota bacterium]